MRRFILGMAGLAMLTVGASSATAQYDRWNPYLELEGRAGDGIERGQGRAFIPVFQDNSSLLFGDIRLMYTDTQHFEGNFGLGYRKIISSNRIFGVYGFYDVRETHYDNVFHQGSAGAELLDINWGLRVNGYIPDSGAKYAPGANAFVQGNQILVQGNQERAYYGMDVEAEHVLWRNDCPTRFLSACDIEVWGAAGYFYFDNNAENFQEMNGPRARVEARLYDLPLLGNDSRIVAGAQYEYDDVRGSSSVGFLNVRIPLGPGGCRGCRPKMNLLDRRMVTPIVRDIDIVTNVAQAGPTDIAMNVVTGTVLDDVVRLTSADDLLAEIEGGPDNRTFILDGVDGGATLTSDIDLNDGQILIGGGGSMRVVGVNSGMNAIFTAKGAPFSIEQTNGAQSVISLASNNGVYGLTTMGGLNSITGAQTGNFEIAGNSLMGATGSSIALFPVTGMTTGFITDNMLSGNNGNAIGVLASVDPMVDLTIARNSFDMIGGNGVNITSLLNSNVTAKIDDNTFNGVEGNAVNMSAINDTVSNIEITNNQINGNATTDDGVNIFLGNNAMMDLVIDNNVIDDVNDDAVQIDSDNVLVIFGSNAILNATITNNTILGRGNTTDGVDILVSDDTVLTGTIANNIFDSVTSDAFELDANDDAVIDLSIVSNMFRGEGVSSDGIDISIEDDNQLTLLVNDNRFEDFTQVAMGIESADDTTTNLTFTNNTILGSGMTVDGIVLDYSDDAELTGTIGNNIIRDVATSAIFIDGADDADFDLSILDNDIRNTQFGIDIFTDSGDDDNSFIIGGNKLKGITDTGIFLFADGTTTLGDNGQDNSVSVEMGGTVFDIDTDGDVIGTIKINGVDEVFP